MFGLVQCLVGVLHHDGCIHAIVRPDRPADTAADGDGLPVDVKRLVDIRDHTAGIRRASSRGVCREVRSTATNSSPPRRATSSWLRTQPYSRFPTCCSSLSPNWWSYESFTFLNP